MKLTTSVDHTERFHVNDTRGLLFCGLGAVVGADRAMRAHIYTAAGTVTPETYKQIDPEKLATDLEVDMCAVNAGRFWMMDEYEFTGGEINDFHGVPMRWAGDMVGSDMMSYFTNFYIPSMIYRNTIWTFHAGKAVHLLREPSGAVWVMQEYGKEIDPTLEPDNLDQLGGKLKQLPEGWTFETKILDKELVLDTSRAGGWAAILRDDMGCAYQGCGYGADTNANYVP